MFFITPLFFFESLICMKSLPTLIKLAQRAIDDLAVEIASGQSQIDGLRTAKASFAAKAQAEQAMANEDIQMLAALPAFLYRAQGEQERLSQEIEQAEAALKHVREKLRAAYREKAKLEKLDEAFLRRRRAEEAAAEQAMLDEAALTRRA